MTEESFYNSSIEKMERNELDSLVDERVQNTVLYAAENSPFYRKWFEKNRTDPRDIKSHDDLRELPVISGGVIRKNQPPAAKEFLFRSVKCSDVYTIHETSGTSGVPKSFFLAWDDWKRYAEKYSRIFVSQGLKKGDRMAVCASYGMNVGANTMTLAAHRVGFTVIPEGRCSFQVRVIENYRPTAIVGSVFKLLHLAQRLEEAGINPRESGVEKLIVGGESFAKESRDYLDEVWGIEVCNTYGSTEGTMCGECRERAGLHVAEDLIHMDLYDSSMKNFVDDGKKGKIVLTTLVPKGEKAANVLINYDTEDITKVISRDKCRCGRTHMRIDNPFREAETIYISDSPVNRVDIESGVFQTENMGYITGDYEAFLYGGRDEGETVLRVSLECKDLSSCDKRLVENNFTGALLKKIPGLTEDYLDGYFRIMFNFTNKGGLELHKITGRPKRFVDRR
ncbi:coenzyme F390 synthetase [Methanomicrobium sp. W14]|uniref:coenzyme F390 synthetase n=1 Tax=Methanomicrobium sp. W14 TaxID=2817839 RepID=UPI001AE338F7|nr:coenzyme F390 synthetase [Methanomicrobium sp. W14]MBP2132638.1 coenzyme F390 synthetase [Methanomicrobium sp. W14]